MGALFSLCVRGSLSLDSATEVELVVPDGVHAQGPSRACTSRTGCGHVLKLELPRSENHGGYRRVVNKPDSRLPREVTNKYQVQLQALFFCGLFLCLGLNGGSVLFMLQSRAELPLL